MTNNRFYDRLISGYPELVYPDITITSENRFGLKTESTGKIILEVGVIAKDF